MPFANKTVISLLIMNANNPDSVSLIICNDGGEPFNSTVSSVTCDEYLSRVVFFFFHGIIDDFVYTEFPHILVGMF